MTSEAAADISRPPSVLETVADKVFRRLALAGAIFTLFLVVWLVVSISKIAAPAIHTYGASLLVGTQWDANRGEFGILSGDRRYAVQLDSRSHTSALFSASRSRSS